MGIGHGRAAGGRGSVSYTHLTIQQMAQELLRQSKAKQDYLVNTGSLSLSVTTEMCIRDSSGTAHDLLLDRRQRFLIGSSYRVYLQSPPGAALPGARVPHGALLGLEEIEECRAESEIDCQAAAQEDSNIIKTKKYDEWAQHAKIEYYCRCQCREFTAPWGCE